MCLHVYITCPRRVLAKSVVIAMVCSDGAVMKSYVILIYSNINNNCNYYHMTRIFYYFIAKFASQKKFLPTIGLQLLLRCYLFLFSEKYA